MTSATEKNRIKVFAIRREHWFDEWMGAAFVDDMGIIASHACSASGWVPHDMGITSDWKHEAYDELFPDGWEIEYMGETDVDGFKEYARAHGVGGDER